MDTSRQIVTWTAFAILAMFELVFRGLITGIVGSPPILILNDFLLKRYYPPSHSTEKEGKEAQNGGNEDGGEDVKEGGEEGGEEGGGDKRAA